MTRTYQHLVDFIRGLLWIFFRQVRVAGVENVPREGGGLLVAWHPNALLDPGLIIATMPRRIVFGARSGLFKVPLLSSLMRAVGTVPIYRRHHGGGGRGVSEEERRAANRRSLDALAGAIAGGDFAALFPEGQSHDEPAVQDLKTGAASLYYRALELTPEGEPPPVILPVGLHYDEKGAFGSRALVVFHPPLELPDELAQLPAADAPAEGAEGAAAGSDPERAATAEASPEAPPEAPLTRRQIYRGLTAVIETSLQESVYGVASWRLHQLMQRSRKLMRAERAARAGADPGRADIQERVLGFARLWEGYRQRLVTHPRQVAELEERVEVYDDDLRALGLEDHELDSDPAFAAFWPSALLAAQVIFVYLLLPPILLIGYLVNLPTALLLIGVSKLGSAAYKDEATVKLLLGAIAFPVTWLTVAVAVGWGERHLAYFYPAIPEAPWWTGVIAFFLSAAGGAVALIYWRLARLTFRNLRVRLTRAQRHRSVERLRQERGAIFDLLSTLAQGLTLPGRVESDGRVTDTAGEVAPAPDAPPQ